MVTAFSASSVRLRAFAKKGETETAKKSLSFLLPGAEIAEETLSAEDEGGVFLSELTVLLAKTAKQREGKEFLARMKAGLGGKARMNLAEEAECRVDEEGNFFFRIDAHKAAEGKIEPSETGIHVKIKVRAHPKSKATALVKEWLASDAPVLRRS